MFAQDITRYDLLGQVYPGSVIAPGRGGPAVEVVGLACELDPVLAAGDGPLAGGVEDGEVGLFEILDRSDAAAFGGLDVA